MEDKEQKVQVIADVIQQLLQQVDIFTQVLTKEDFELLDEAKDSLEKKINYKQSASVLFYALGADADTTEDEMKLKTIELLIKLMKTRIEFREEMVRIQEENRNKQDAINLFRSMGML